MFNDRAATGCNPNAEQCRLIKAEEVRAWQHARDELRSLDFKSWPRFHARRRKDLKRYDELLQEPV